MSQEEYVCNYNDNDEIQKRFEILDDHLTHMEERRKFMEKEMKDLFEKKKRLWESAEAELQRAGLVDNPSKKAIWYNKKGQVFMKDRDDEHPLAGLLGGLFS